MGLRVWIFFLFFRNLLSLSQFNFLWTLFTVFGRNVTHLIFEYNLFLKNVSEESLFCDKRKFYLLYWYFTDLRTPCACDMNFHTILMPKVILAKLLSQKIYSLFTFLSYIKYAEFYKLYVRTFLFSICLIWCFFGVFGGILTYFEVLTYFDKLLRTLTHEFGCIRSCLVIV